MDEIPAALPRSSACRTRGFVQILLVLSVSLRNWQLELFPVPSGPRYAR